MNAPSSLRFACKDCDLKQPATRHHRIPMDKITITADLDEIMFVCPVSGVWQSRIYNPSTIGQIAGYGAKIAVEIPDDLSGVVA